MPTCLYLRGVPGTGKRTVSDILERDLKWPVLWCHHFDATYKAIGEHRCPVLTDELMRVVAEHLMDDGRDFLAVRPSRSIDSIWSMEYLADQYLYTFLPVRLTAPYATLCTRVTRRWHESEFRITTKEALDEYLNARPETEFPGEHVIDTERLTPEQVAGRIKELLPK